MLFYDSSVMVAKFHVGCDCPAGFQQSFSKSDEPAVYTEIKLVVVVVYYAKQHVLCRCRLDLGKLSLKELRHSLFWLRLR